MNDVKVVEVFMTGAKVGRIALTPDALCVFEYDPAYISSAGKIHTVSAAGLLHADYRIPCLDYLDLLKLCHILTKNMEEVEMLFRLMAFNVAIKNRDDHAKNFSFQLIDREWKLSPAYDLLPSNGFNGFHITTVNNSGEPSLQDMMTVAEKIGLNKQRARDIIRNINKEIKNR